MNHRINFDLVVNSTLFIFSIVLLVLTADYPFYWDNIVQTSVPAHWFYETDFKYFYLPADIATGHPTYVGMYFAFLWKLFGRSLVVAHWGMLPFVFGLLFQLKRLLQNLHIDHQRLLLILLLFVVMDATVLSQLSLITFDIIQLFFFFLCLNLMITNRNIAFAACYTVLVSISLRASMMAFGVLIFNLLYDYFIKNNIRYKAYFKYLPGILALFLFLLLFKINNGWVIHNTVSNQWEDSGKTADFYQILRNIGVFVWRSIDFGRVGIFGFFLFFVIKIMAVKKFPDQASKTLFLIAFSQFIVFFPIIIMYQNAFGHRYLLPIIMPISLLVVYWVHQYLKYSVVCLGVLLALLLSGHFWLYPPKISQGWDATTLHWRYMNVAKQMNAYVDEHDIEASDIASFFPASAPRYLTYLEEEKNEYFQGDTFESKYILYSNAFNVDDNVIDSLYAANSNWTVVKKISDGRIFIALYHKLAQ